MRFAYKLNVCSINPETAVARNKRHRRRRRRRCRRNDLELTAVRQTPEGFIAFCEHSLWKS